MTTHIPRSVKNEFHLPDWTYLLSHSVGRPLKSTQQMFENTFFEPWFCASESGKATDKTGEPWNEWLKIIDEFRDNIALLLNTSSDFICPQVNLSSALTKIVMSHTKLQQERPVVLMSEQDFPSMGFVLKAALPSGADIRFIPKESDITDSHTWEQYLNTDIDFVFISHAYSNSGQAAPVKDILSIARSHNILSLVDIAQSVGCLPVDLEEWRADFVIGSSIKWLCGGPGAAYLWVNPNQIEQCSPKDVGWFSHEMPFEFNIHDFRYAKNALKFWGGTPSIAPYAIANHSIGYFCQLEQDLGKGSIRQHNQHLIDSIISEAGDCVRSPLDKTKRSGTVILHLGAGQERAMASFKEAKISVDAREIGIRVSPHLYTTNDDIDYFVEILKTVL